MLSDEKRNLFRLIDQKIDDEYVFKTDIDTLFWANIYSSIPVLERKHFWWIKFGELEHRIHGELHKDAVEHEIDLILSVLRDKDEDCKAITLYLYDRLINNMLQIDEVSQYAACKLKEKASDLFS
jgi:hypothetical protein